MKIFISYSWNNEIEADEIDKAFKNKGIVLTRDKRHLEYKQSIQDFMKSIRTHDYAILLISHDYLTSENCMYEFLEVFKEEDVMKKILPVILTDYFFDSNFKMKYIKYWNKKVNETKNKIDEIYREGLLEHLEDEAKKLKKYQKISLEIADIIGNLQAKKMVKFSDESTNSFKNIFKAIGLNEKEDIPSIKANLGIPKFEVNFKAGNPIAINHTKDTINYESEKNKLLRGIVDDGVIQYIIFLLKGERICRFIIKNNENIDEISNVFLKVNSNLQEKIMEQIFNNHVEATGYNGWENYDYFGRLAFEIYSNSQNNIIKNIAYNIIESCARYRGQFYTLLKQLEDDMYI